MDALRRCLEDHAAWFHEPEARLAHGDFDTTPILHADGRYTGIIDSSEVRGTGWGYLAAARDCWASRRHQHAGSPVNQLAYNVLAMGDEEARALGVCSDQMKVIIVICVTLITASVVSISGIIGWVGRVIPHIARMIVGPDHRVLLPSTLALGAAYLLAIDDIARSVSQAEIPVGILTAIVGAPFFAVLLRRAKGGWG